MTDGAIGFDRGKGFVARCIRRITKSPWTHTKTYIHGFTFESTIWWVGYWWKTGIKVTRGLAIAHQYKELKKHMTEMQINREIDYWIDNLNKRRHYNIAKLVVLAFVIPHRDFFEKLGWIPFDKSGFGDVCSVSCDEAKKEAGIDLIPGRKEGYSSPGALYDSKLLA